MFEKKAYHIDCDTYKGIIKIVYKDDHEFNINDAKKSLKDIEQITNGKTLPILKVPGKYSSIDNEARKFISSSEGMKHSSAEAFVTTFLPHRIIGNFYMKINKPVKPTAFFESEKQAIEWLKKFISPTC
jgi:hypothetical protein